MVILYVTPLSKNNISVSNVEHSYLLSGYVYVPKHLEYRRLADYKFNCIHPCCSFPLTDLVINVPVAK